VLAEPLGLPSAKLKDLRAGARSGRAALIQRALSLSSGSHEDPIWHPVSSPLDDWNVGFLKPGKEASRSRRTNPHDMRPAVYRGAQPVAYTPSFAELFGVLAALSSKRTDREALELLACLFVRSAYLLDHQLAPDLCYSPPREVVAAVANRAPVIGPLPVPVFLQLVEAIAWNDDVKYGVDKARLDDAGRANCLLTLAHFAAASLDRVRDAQVAGMLASARSGVAPIGLRDAISVFPLLNGPEWQSSQARLEAEMAILDVLSSLRGMDADDICRHVGCDISRAKNRKHLAATRAIHHLVPDAEWATKGHESPLKVATLTLGRRLKSNEDYALGGTAGVDILLEDTWEESRLFREITQRFILLVFVGDDPLTARLSRVVAASLSPRDVARANRTWTETRQYWRNRSDKLPAEADGPDVVCFVRTRDAFGRRSTDALGNEQIVTKRAFWLSGDFLARLANRP
jgi:hypothetical protein